MLRIRHLTVASLSAVALLASAAFADGAEFHSELASTAITSTPKGTGSLAHQLIHLQQNWPITCSGVDLKGTMTGKTVAALTLEAEFKGCARVGAGTAVTVEMRGCALLLSANETFGLTDKGEKGSCAAEPMRIYVPVVEAGTYCESTIGPQTGLKKMTYTNVTNANKEILVATSVEGIKYTTAGTGCFSVGTFEDGHYYTGSYFLTGAEPAGGKKMTNIWWE